MNDQMLAMCGWFLLGLFGAGLWIMIYIKSRIPWCRNCELRITCPDHSYGSDEEEAD